MLCRSVLIVCFLSYVLCAPQAPQVLDAISSTPVPIIAQSEELEPNGTYKYSYETGNGIKVEAISYEKQVPAGRSADSTESDIHVQQGSYSYTAPDGTVISLRYIADENGFQPIGDHLPTSPPIPADILASLRSSDSVSAGSDESASPVIVAAPAPAEPAPVEPVAPVEQVSAVEEAVPAEAVAAEAVPAEAAPTTEKTNA